MTSRQSGHAGQPCQRWAVKGSDFCAVHGGTIKLGLADPASFRNRCTAHSTRTKEQCKNPAIRGGTVCRTHGGASPQVQKKARERLLELVEPAITQLNRVLDAPGTSDGDRLRAIQMVLDRTGFGPGSTVEHESRPWEIAIQHIFVPGALQGIKREPPAELEPIVLPMTEATFSNTDDEDDSPSAEIIYLPPIGSADPPKRPR